MAKTAQNLITRAYRLCGAISSGQEPTSDESDDGLEALNEMLTSWSEQNITVPYRVEDVATLQAGKTSYTIGIGGDINTERPLSVQEAWLVDASGSSYEFEITMMLREYARIVLKNQLQRPYRAWYEPTYPLGTLTLDGMPDQVYTLNFWSLKQLTEFSALTTESVLPVAYDRAMRFNLAIELGGELGNPLDARVVQIARDSFKNIKNANMARRVSKLSTDTALSWGRKYNIYTDS
jgi:hypothetical protein